MKINKESIISQIMKFYLLILTFLIINYKQSFAQNKEKSKDNHEHTHIKNEFGFANSPVFFLNENKIAYGLHFHFIRQISSSKLGIGFGYEMIFDNHKHKTIGIVCSYNPTNNITLNLSPGFAFENNLIKNSQLAMHIESTYNFEFKKYHIGPIIELGIDKKDKHLSIGLHFGFGF